MQNDFNTQKAEIPTEEELHKQIMLTSDYVWGSKLSWNDVEKWLRNFNGMVCSIDDERCYALYLLASFVYYNDNEVRHLCRTLFHDFLHGMLLRQEGTNKYSLEIQLDTIMRTSAFCPLGKPGESGSFVLYYFRQENQIPTGFISDPSKLPAYINTIVFIDDVTISGTQALEDNDIGSFVDGKREVILLTFLSTQNAVNDLNAKGVRVISCIDLDERSKCFSEKGNLKRDFPESYDSCKRFAIEYGKKSIKNQSGIYHPLGFMDGEYMFGFFYNTPDNTLPIFWADNKGWMPIPILKRYEKYREVLYREYGRFV